MAEFSMDVKFDRENNVITVAETRIVLQCHHYNSQLQQTLELTEYIDGPRIIRRSAENVFFKQFHNYLSKNDVSDSEKLEVAAEMYRTLGFGTLDFSGIGEGVVYAPTSHFATGWLAKFGNRESPACHFTAGYIAGVMRAATGKHYEVIESECVTMGAEKCKFTVKEAPAAPDTVQIKEVRFTPAPFDETSVKTNIDESKIIDWLSGAGIMGDEEGLIPAFGVYLAIMPAEFYNRVSYGFERQLQEVGMGLETSAIELLVYAGVVCGLKTLGGVTKSQEWKSLVEPMIEVPEDKIYGMVAVTNALGWGRWQVMELVPGERLVMRSYNPGEALGYMWMYGESELPKCYMLTGVSGAMMELTYLEEERLGQYDFISEETKCIAKGDPYCEFEVIKSE